MGELQIVVREETAHVASLDLFTDVSDDSGFAALRDAVAEDVAEALKYQEQTEEMLEHLMASLKRAVSSDPAESEVQGWRSYLGRISFSTKRQALSAQAWEIAQYV